MERHSTSPARHEPDWDHSQSASSWRRAVKPLVLVMAGVVIGGLTIPGSSAPSLPVAVDDESAVQAEAAAEDRDRGADVPSRGSDAGHWEPMAGGPLDSRRAAAAVWSGNEMIVWGGFSADGTPLADGAAYDPRTDRWRILPPAPISARGDTASTWTGEELVVWGGAGGDPAGTISREGTGGERAPTLRDDGAAYDPARDRWRRLPPTRLSARRGAEAVWTGSHLVVWGGFGPDDATQRDDGARLALGPNRWRPVAAGPLTGRSDIDVQVEPLDGGMFVWSASHDTAVTAFYDPERDSWRRLPTPRLRPGSVPAFVPVDGAVMAWGESSLDGGGPRALRFTLDPDWWLTIAEPPFAPPRPRPVAAGGDIVAYTQAQGAVYDSVANRWSAMGDAPLAGDGPAVQLWAGDRLIVWRAGAAAPQPRRGAVWLRGSPWETVEGSPTALGNGLSVVWTGWLQASQQLVTWGGAAGAASDVGAAYDPSLQLWETVPPAPQGPRTDHAAVWVGEEMAVAGGRAGPGRPLRTEVSAYHVPSREWRILPDAPVRIGAHGMVWTGARLYAAGRRDGRIAVAEFNPSTEAWGLLPEPPLPQDPKLGPTLLFNGVELWLWAAPQRGPGTGRLVAWSARRQRWRELPTLDDVWGPTSAVWTGRHMFVLDEHGATASLAPNARKWRTHPDSPVQWQPVLAWTHRMVVAYSPGRRRVAALDPRADAWIRVPSPPLPPSDFGTLAWTGRQLFAFAGGEAAVLAP